MYREPIRNKLTDEVEGTCIKAIYRQKEAENKVDELRLSDPNFTWEVGYCSICRGLHVYKDGI